MGCKGSKNVKYDFKDSKRSIPIKHAKTLDRWSLGAHARIKVMKMKRDEIKKIIGKLLTHAQLFYIQSTHQCGK